MQKLAFIRALSSGIDTLLLDESTANLDEKTKAKIFDILSNRDQLLLIQLMTLMVLIMSIIILI